MSVERAGRKYACERCGDVTWEEVEECPQNGCPLWKLVAKPIEAPLPQPLPPLLDENIAPVANPYAYSGTENHGPALVQSGSQLARAYAGIFALSFVFYVVAFGLMIFQAAYAKEDFRLQTIGESAMFFAYLTGMAAFVVLQIWLAKTWSLVPAHYGHINPVLVVVLQFIPCFNIYWWFRIAPGLSTALANMRQDQDPTFENRSGFWLGILSFFFAFVTPFWVLNADRVKNQYLEGVANKSTISNGKPIAPQRPNYWGD